jgi:hypothetical protein
VDERRACTASLPSTIAGSAWSRAAFQVAGSTGEILEWEADERQPALVEDVQAAAEKPVCVASSMTVRRDDGAASHLALFHAAVDPVEHAGQDRDLPGDDVQVAMAETGASTRMTTLPTPGVGVWTSSITSGFPYYGAVPRACDAPRALGSRDYTAIAMRSSTL